MSIRPIDVQASVTRSLEVNRSSSHDASRPNVQQQQFANQLDKQVRHEQQSVIGLDKTDKSIVDKDGSNKGKQESKDKKDETKENKEQKNISAGHAAFNKYKSTSMVDIKI